MQDGTSEGEINSQRLSSILCTSATFDVMNKIDHLLFPGHLKRSPVKYLIFTLSLMGLIILEWGLSTKVMAQNSNVSSTEVLNYAKSVLAMEQPRQEAFERIKKAINGQEVPKIVCNDPNSINNLPDAAKKIAVSYCNRSQKIVEENGLTIERFNRITLEIQNNGELNRQVYNTLLRLQKSPESP
ncbi:MAG TPA: DUF4168 domain-containing protein [Nostocaceae cyanobacterium]|nr:DUF4168 domain-containing protein [Nostocaceae cyanobacterium]